MRPTPRMAGRAGKTRRRLHDALVSLVHEKSYPSIIVNEILERADVGRSAFYAHFENKDALLTSTIERVLRSAPSREPATAAGPFGNALSFSFPLFAYIGQCRGTLAFTMHRTGRSAMHQHLRRVLADWIADDVKAAQRASRTPTNIPPEVLTGYIVGTFILVLNWWVERDRSIPAEAVNDLFLDLVAPTLAAAEHMTGTR